MTQARRILAPVLAALLSACSGLAEAQSEGGAQSTLIDPSIRSAGMGRTGVAVFWGGDPNSWVNPSLLGYYQGIRYEGGETQLIPDLADDVSFTSNQMTFGAYGVGISMEGDPFDGFGGVKLDYGTSAATDVDGNVIGYFNSFEEIESFSVGVSVAQLAESIGQALGKDMPTISRYGDVSLGQTWKSVLVSLGPGSVALDSLGAQDGEGNQRDHGIFARATPYNSIQYPGTWVGLERYLRARLDLSYGASAINYDENERISYTPAGGVDPFAKDSRNGWAIHADFTLPMSAEESIRSGQFGWVYDLITPLLSFGSTWEKSQYSVQGADVGEEIDLYGKEVTFANIFTLRRGHINDPTGAIVGETEGWSVGLAFDGIGGARYDHATIPQSYYSKQTVTREGFTVFFDPIALSQRLH